LTAPALPNAPQIGSTGLLQQPGIAQQIAPLLEAVTQHRLVNAQLEAYRGLTEERKLKAAQQARDAQDAADAASAFYRHISGSEQRLKPAQAKEGEPPPHQGVDESSGMLIPLPQFEKGLSPQAHAYYLGMIGEHNKAIQQGFEAARSKVSAEHEQIATDIVRAGLTRDTAVRTALGKYEGRLDDPTTQRKALADVAAIDPNAAKGLADAFNVGSDRYKNFIAPDGFNYILDSKLGVTRKDRAVGQKVAVNQDAIQRGAKTIVDLLDEQSGIIKQTGLAGSKNPTLAQLAQTARVLGIPTEAVANFLRSDPQQLTQLLKTRFAHNYIGLLPHSRGSAQLLTNLTESYWAPAGSSPATLARAEQDRNKLRAMLDQIAKGNIDLSKLPGFSEAAQAAVAEGQQIAAPVGPDGAATYSPDNPFVP